MFMGNYQNSIDAKGRMIIPAKFRAELGCRCVVSRGIDRCLYIYTMEDWEAWAEKLRSLPNTDREARNFKRHFFGYAEECEIDKQGRINIPLSLKEYGDFEKELVTVGASDKIEVWSRKIWDDEDQVAQLDGAAMAENMAKYDI